MLILYYLRYIAGHPVVGYCTIPKGGCSIQGGAKYALKGSSDLKRCVVTWNHCSLPFVCLCTNMIDPKQMALKSTGLPCPISLFIRYVGKGVIL